MRQILIWYVWVVGALLALDVGMTYAGVEWSGLVEGSRVMRGLVMGGAWGVVAGVKLVQWAGMVVMAWGLVRVTEWGGLPEVTVWAWVVPSLVILVSGPVVTWVSGVLALWR